MMTTSDEDRPRPEYGEYATPQQQAEAMARYQPAIVADARKTSVPNTPPAPSSMPRGSSPTTGGFVNRFFTLFLLAFGIVYVIGGAASFIDLPSTLDSFYKQWGIGNYTAIDLASMLGIIALVCQAIVWVVTAIFAIRRLRRGLSSWWIPVIGAVLSFLVTITLMTIAMLSDPAFSAYLTRG